MRRTCGGLIRRPVVDEGLKEFISEYFDTFYDKNDLKFAQAIAAFTEKRVLEELKLEMCLSPEPCNPALGLQCDNCELIDQRLAALAGKEKSGKD